MPPKTIKVAASASSTSNNSSTLLKGFKNVISTLHAKFELFRCNPIEDLRTVFARPDLAEVYQKMVPNPMWLERMRDIDYTAWLQEEVRSGRAQTQQDFLRLWDAAVGRLRMDFNLIVANCTAFNRDAAEIMQITADFEKAANAECDSLQQAGATMFATGAAGGGFGGGGGADMMMAAMAMPQSGGGKGVVKAGTAGASAGGKGKRRGRGDDGDEQEEDPMLTQRLPITTTKAAALKNVKKAPQQQQPHQPQEVAPAAPVVVQEVLTPEQKVERIRQQYKHHEQVSGPLALKVPEPLRQRMLQQHAAFANACHVPGLSIPTLQRSNTSSTGSSSSSNSTISSSTPLIRGYDPAAPEESDTVISVLRDFFMSVCEKNRVVSASEDSNNKKNDAKASVAAVIGNALRYNFDQTPCPYLPSYFGELKQQQQQTTTSVIFPTTHSKAPEKVKHCWNALTKVLLPFFNEAAFKCYLYSDERSALNWHSVQMALDQEKQGAAPWHTVMHFDVLIRALADLPVAASAVLGESFKRAAANTVIPQSLPDSAQSNFYGDASVIVGRTVVPVLNELLQFICDSKLAM